MMFKKQKKFGEEDNILLKENNRVIVRVWLSKINNQVSNAFKVTRKIIEGKGQNANIGHASIETPNKYASVWPADDEEVSNVAKCYRSKYEESSVEDDLAEQNRADFTVCFYSLNVAAIEEAFDEIKKKDLGYVFVGESSIAAEEGQNCTSLSYFLLRAGGISKLNPYKSVTMNTAIIQPNDFADFICNAKLKELKQYPETLNFNQMEDEYMPELNQESRCSIC